MDEWIPILFWLTLFAPFPLILGVLAWAMFSYSRHLRVARRYMERGEQHMDRVEELLEKLAGEPPRKAPPQDR